MALVTKLTLEYDGTDFAGWACQPGKRTVQAELERALRTILGERALDGDPLGVSVAGRTDRGVHARAQVASYAHEAVDPSRLNGLLAPDMAVLSCEPERAGFDARHDATSRTYCYRLHTRRTRSAFERRHALWHPRALDRHAMRAAAATLVGDHDFTAFTPTETEHLRFDRNVVCAEWREHGDVLEFWIEANAFLRHMNRALVGTLLEVGAGVRGVADFARLLDGRPRCEAGPTAPAHGLTLVSVSYAGAA